MLIKLLGSETTLTSATNVGSATVVRVYNSDTAGTITQKTNASPAVTVGTITLAAGEVAFIEKNSTDTLEGGAKFKAVKVAYKN